MIFEFKGQIHGGKNNICMTRTGHRYPNPVFAEWKNIQILNLLAQKRPYAKFLPIKDNSLIWVFNYTPEDKRRRDLPAILDAVFHCLEKAGVVADDCLIKNICFKNNPPDKGNACLTIEITR